MLYLYNSLVKLLNKSRSKLLVEEQCRIIDNTVDSEIIAKIYFLFILRIRCVANSKFSLILTFSEVSYIDIVEDIDGQWRERILKRENVALMPFTPH